MIQIFRKEFASFLDSLIAYIVIGIFLTVTGLLIWVFPETSVLDYGYAGLETLFNFAPYVFMFLIPAITMRMFAEERKSGTMELLLTKPITDWGLILGKYSAGLLLVAFTLIPTGIYYYAVYQLGNPPGNLDSAGIAGSYIGLFMLAAVFTAIGLFSSSLSENQIVAFIIGVFGCFITFTGFSSLAGLEIWGDSSLSVEKLGILYHYNALSKGLLDSRDLLYFGSSTAFFLLFTHLTLKSRTW